MYKIILGLIVFLQRERRHNIGVSYTTLKSMILVKKKEEKLSGLPAEIGVSQPETLQLSVIIYYWQIKLESYFTVNVF